RAVAAARAGAGPAAPVPMQSEHAGRDAGGPRARPAVLGRCAGPRRPGVARHQPAAPAAGPRGPGDVKDTFQLREGPVTLRTKSIAGRSRSGDNLTPPASVVP